MAKNKTIYCKHPEVFERAKKIALLTGTNISAVVEQRLAVYIQENQATADAITDLLKARIVKEEHDQS